MAEEKGFSLTEIPENTDIKNVLQTESSYFYVEVDNHKLIHTIKKYFPLQFGR